MVAEAEGSFDAAESHYADSLEQAKELGTTAEAAECLIHLAHAAQARGDLPRARERLDEAQATGALQQRPDLQLRARELDAVLREPADPHP
jgi:hypothetical protein